VHEVGMCQSLLDAVERRAAGRRVTGVKVRVGVLHRVADLRAFGLVAVGSVAENAEVDMVVVPVRATCRACAVETEADEVPVACPACGAFDLDLAGGDEFVLESIRLAEAG
jgi:hydrogenase nickel incorporation protein HypA/HybF